MPVTAKLSRKFYDTLGDEIANELVEWFNGVDATYKADLRELNESDFQRFDAKLEQRMARLDAKLTLRMSQLDANLTHRLAQLDRRLTQRISDFDTKLERRLAEQDAKLETGLAGLRTELHAMRASLTRWRFATSLAIVGLVFAMLRLGA